MRYELATNDQLENISRFDIDCPPSLLREVVIEMLNRSMFDAIILDCFKKTIGSFKRMSQIYKLDMEDFLQIGNACIYKSIDRYDRDRGDGFTSFVFVRVQQEFIRLIEFLERGKRDFQKDFSYNVENEEGEELINAYSYPTNVEKYVINKITIEELLSVASEKQKDIIHLRLKDYTIKEIGEMYGISRQAVEGTLERAIKRYRKGA